MTDTQLVFDMSTRSLRPASESELATVRAYVAQQEAKGRKVGVAEVLCVWPKDD